MSRFKVSKVQDDDQRPPSPAPGPAPDLADSATQDTGQKELATGDPATPSDGSSSARDHAAHLGSPPNTSTPSSGVGQSPQAPVWAQGEETVKGRFAVRPVAETVGEGVKHRAKARTGKEYRKEVSWHAGSSSSSEDEDDHPAPAPAPHQPDRDGLQGRPSWFAVRPVDEGLGRSDSTAAMEARLGQFVVQRGNDFEVLGGGGLQLATAQAATRQGRFTMRPVSDTESPSTPSLDGGPGRLLPRKWGGRVAGRSTDSNASRGGGAQRERSESLPRDHEPAGTPRGPGSESLELVGQRGDLGAVARNPSLGRFTVAPLENIQEADGPVLRPGSQPCTEYSKGRFRIKDFPPARARPPGLEGEASARPSLPSCGSLPNMGLLPNFGLTLSIPRDLQPGRVESMPAPEALANVVAGPPHIQPVEPYPAPSNQPSLPLDQPPDAAYVHGGSYVAAREPGGIGVYGWQPYAMGPGGEAVPLAYTGVTTPMQGPPGNLDYKVPAYMAATNMPGPMGPHDYMPPPSQPSQFDYSPEPPLPPGATWEDTQAMAPPTQVPEARVPQGSTDMPASPPAGGSGRGRRRHGEMVECGHVVRRLEVVQAQNVDQQRRLKALLTFLRPPALDHQRLTEPVAPLLETISVQLALLDAEHELLQAEQDQLRAELLAHGIAPPPLGQPPASQSPGPLGAGATSRSSTPTSYTSAAPLASASQTLLPHLPTLSDVQAPTHGAQYATFPRYAGLAARPGVLG